eukprot:snap_masked-scaffold_3-processed-gene-21.43-mRNA-1 protein AED:1.00 eAED:1.00 QI:0/-1/0/0/-1/1/1/0/302
MKKVSFARDYHVYDNSEKVKPDPSGKKIPNKSLLKVEPKNIEFVERNLMFLEDLRSRTVLEAEKPKRLIVNNFKITEKNISDKLRDIKVSSENNENDESEVSSIDSDINFPGEENESDLNFFSEKNKREIKNSVNSFKSNFSVFMSCWQLLTDILSSEKFEQNDEGKENEDSYLLETMYENSSNIEQNLRKNILFQSKLFWSVLKMSEIKLRLNRQFIVVEVEKMFSGRLFVKELLDLQEDEYLVVFTLLVFLNEEIWKYFDKCEKIKQDTKRKVVNYIQSKSLRFSVDEFDVLLDHCSKIG